MSKESTHGGIREGAGPPQKYGEETVNVTFRVPISKKEDFRAYGNKKLDKWKKKKPSKVINHG